MAYICNAYLSWHRSRTFSHNHSNFFFQVTTISVYKKAVASLGSFQRDTLYRDMHRKSPWVPRRQGYGLQGFPGYRAVELESSSNLEFSSAKDLSLTHEQIKTGCSCSSPQPCWARGPFTHRVSDSH